MRLALYARYSTDRQSELSIDDQLRVCRGYADKHGWVVDSEHTDAGISGAAMGNRPGAQAAVAALGHGDILLIADLSRLARSQDLGPLINRLRYRGARVIGVQDGFDSDSGTARMQAGLSGLMSEEFRAMIAARTHSGLELRARAGRPTGGKLYGNTEIVQEIFARFADGESMRAIASDLNRRGIPSPGAGWQPRSGVRGRWLVSAIYAMLQNPHYAGRVIWNRSQWVRDPDTGKRRRVERPESEWIVRECEPVVDPALFARAQARIGQRKGRGGAPRYLLSGLLECALCGARLVVVGGSQHRYACSQNKQGGPHACGNGATFPRATAERLILEPIERDLLSPAAIRAGLAEMRKARIGAERTPVAEDAEIRELDRMVREGLLSTGVAAPALQEAKRRAQERRSAETGVGMPWPTESLWRATVEGMRAALRGEDVHAAREALREILGPIRCRPAEGYVVAEIAARSVWLRTGSGSWVGSGGVQRIQIPVSSRPGTPPDP